MGRNAKGLNAAGALVLGCAILAGCSQTGGYPNVYGDVPAKTRPLSPGPGGGLWSPNDISAPKSTSAAYLFSYLPRRPPPPPPGNAVDISNLLTPAQQAQVEQERARRGAAAADAMKQRLLSEGRLNR